MSLRSRLLTGLAILVFVSVASSGWLVLKVASARLQEAKDARAQSTAAPMIAALEASASDATTLKRTAQALSPGALAGLVIVDSNGAAQVGGAIVDGKLAVALGGATFAVRSGRSVFVYAPLRRDNQIVGAARLELADAQEIGRAIAGTRGLLIAVTLFDGGLVMLFGALFIRKVVQPLESLEAAARRVAAGDFDSPPIPTGERADEISRLTEAFNRMTGSLR